MLHEVLTIDNKKEEKIVRRKTADFNFKNFTKKTTQERTSRGFNKNRSRKWLESGLQTTDAGFAQWLRDESKISPVQLLDNYNDEELREQYW